MSDQKLPKATQKVPKVRRDRAYNILKQKFAPAISLLTKGRRLHVIEYNGIRKIYEGWAENFLLLAVGTSRLLKKSRFTRRRPMGMPQRGGKVHHCERLLSCHPEGGTTGGSFPSVQ